MTFKITLWAVWGTGWGERLQTVTGSRETGRQGWSESKGEMVVAWTRMPAEKETKGGILVIGLCISQFRDLK